MTKKLQPTWASVTAPFAAIKRKCCTAMAAPLCWSLWQSITVIAQKQNLHQISEDDMLLGNQASIVVATPHELQALIRDAIRAEMFSVKSTVDTKEVLNEKQAAAHIGQQPGTLRQWRSLSKGPAYHKKGRRVFYKKN